MVAWLPAAIAGVASLAGTFLSNKAREEGQRAEMAKQEEFAQHGIRWRVEDAKRAGIHPIYALGASGPTYSPVGLGQNDTAAGFADAGQSFSRAIDATRPASERAEAFTEATQRLSLDRMDLENQLLRSQIALVQQGGGHPSFPGSDYMIPGQGNSPVVMRNPFGWGETTVVNPGLAEESQRHFGEPGEWIYGGGNMLESWVQSARDDMQKGVDQKYKGRPSGATYPVWY